MKKAYVGIDFEFNHRKIALCQLGFFPQRNKKFIWLVNPTLFTEDQTTMFIENVFISQYIRKILHGCDSLDIPYIFNELFLNDTTYIYKFISKISDTRFMCEYYKLVTDSFDNKCSIYDSLLLFNIVDKQKYNELVDINESIGPIHDVSWDIKKISIIQTKYALYDVYYLKDL